MFMPDKTLLLLCEIIFKLRDIPSSIHLLSTWFSLLAPHCSRCLLSTAPSSMLGSTHSNPSSGSVHTHGACPAVSVAESLSGEQPNSHSKKDPGPLTPGAEADPALLLVPSVVSVRDVVTAQHFFPCLCWPCLSSPSWNSCSLSFAGCSLGSGQEV